MCVCAGLTIQIKRIFSYSFHWIALKLWWNVLWDHVIMGCAFKAICRFLNFWQIFENIYIGT